MPDTTTNLPQPDAADRPAPVKSQSLMQPEHVRLKRRFPTALDLRARARRRMPNFAFEYVDGGAGADTGIARNWGAFDAIEMMPRYGNVVSPPPTDIELFGRAYGAPFGISPIGGPGTGFPARERRPGCQIQSYC